jgi:hypothetical protein
MNIGFVILIGGVGGFLDGVGIFFEPKEPYKIEILFAALRCSVWRRARFTYRTCHLEVRTGLMGAHVIHPSGNKSSN